MRILLHQTIIKILFLLLLYHSGKRVVNVIVIIFIIKCIVKYLQPLSSIYMLYTKTVFCLSCTRIINPALKIRYACMNPVQWTLSTMRMIMMIGQVALFSYYVFMQAYHYMVTGWLFVITLVATLVHCHHTVTHCCLSLVFFSYFDDCYCHQNHDCLVFLCSCSSSSLTNNQRECMHAWNLFSCVVTLCRYTE